MQLIECLNPPTLLYGVFHSLSYTFNLRLFNFTLIESLLIIYTNCCKLGNQYQHTSYLQASKQPG